MRLVCPNCGAQYDVDDAVIPEAGRDVQCSNCGHGWFQQPDGARERHSAAARMAAQPGPPRETTKISTGGLAPAESDDDAAPATPAPERPARKALDAAVMDVLREEAEREKAARAAEAPPKPETAPAETTRIVEQPVAEPEPAPAPAPAPDEREVAAATHQARMRGEHPAVAVAALSGRAAHRSEMLPDIEQINSTLRASADPSRAAEEAGAAEEAEKERQKRGFRTGFGLVAVIALSATLLYTQGPRIAEAVPGLAGPITSYVAAVNDGRRWLDNTLRGVGGE